MRKYRIVDAKDKPITATLFKNEREAYTAKQVYLDHCEDLLLPLKIVPVEADQTETRREIDGD